MSLVMLFLLIASIGSSIGVNVAQYSLVRSGTPEKAFIAIGPDVKIKTPSTGLVQCGAVRPNGCPP